LNDGIPIGTDTELASIMTRIFIAGTIMARVAAGRKASRPEPIIRPHLPVVIISPEPRFRVVVRCRRRNRDNFNPALPKDSLVSITLALPKRSHHNTTQVLLRGSLDSIKSHLPKSSPDNTNLGPLLKGNPGSINPDRLPKGSLDSIKRRLPKSSLDNTNPGLLLQNKRGREEKRLSLNIASRRKNLVRSGK
jgi:hypothetical protein